VRGAGGAVDTTVAVPTTLSTAVATTALATTATTAISRGGALRTSNTTLRTTSSTAMGNTSTSSTAMGNTSSTTALNTSSTAALNTSSTTAALNTSNTGAGAVSEVHTSAKSMGARAGGDAGAGAGAGATPPPAAAVEFDKVTGAPTNNAAKKQLARVWKTGVAAEGKKTRVVQVLILPRLSPLASRHSPLSTTYNTAGTSSQPLNDPLYPLTRKNIPAGACAWRHSAAVRLPINPLIDHYNIP